MKLDMVKEYENMKYYLENIFLGEMVSDNADVHKGWAEVQSTMKENMREAGICICL